MQGQTVPWRGSMDPQKGGDGRHTQICRPQGRRPGCLLPRRRSEVTAPFFAVGFRWRDKEVKSKEAKGKSF